MEGVRFEVMNREAQDATRVGIEVLVALQKLYSGKIDIAGGKRLVGSDDVIARIRSGEDPRTIVQSYQDAVEAFARLREPYLLYR